jgi:hypothetical protein
MIRNNNQEPLPMCRSRRDPRRADSVLKRSDKIDRVLGQFLRNYPHVTINDAIQELWAQGW